MSKTKVIDFVERVGATFAMAFMGVALASGVSDVTALKAAAIAGALSVGKFLSVQAASFLKTEPPA